MPVLDTGIQFLTDRATDRIAGLRPAMTRGGAVPAVQTTPQLPQKCLVRYLSRRTEPVRERISRVSVSR